MLTAHESLSQYIPSEHAATALMWMAEQISQRAYLRMAAENALVRSGITVDGLIAYRDATDDMFSLAHSFDSATAPGGGDKC